LNLGQVSREVAARLARIFLPDAHGYRPCHGRERRFAEDPHWKDLVLFHEYFCGDSSRGVGASHQTGWTALAVRFLEDLAAPASSARPETAQSPAGTEPDPTAALVPSAAG
jgi:hypothetical protein